MLRTKVLFLHRLFLWHGDPQCIELVELAVNFFALEENWETHSRTADRVVIRIMFRVLGLPGFDEELVFLVLCTKSIHSNGETEKPP